MADTPKYLPESRAYFRAFVSSHLQDYFQLMAHTRTGGNSGYGRFYRDNEIIDHLRNIVYNLQDHFGNVTIPGEFTSPKRLVESWNGFLSLLQAADGLFYDVLEKFHKENSSPPEPFQWTYRIHGEVTGLMEAIIGMDEVKEYLATDGKTRTMTQTNSFDVVIITALYDTEFEAFLNLLPVDFIPHTQPDDSTNYYKCQIGSLSVLLATDDKMGIAGATALSTKVIAKFTPTYIIMGGIAGGVKDDEKNFGDILITRYTWNYESGKYKYNKEKGKTFFEPNPEQIELDSGLVHKVNALKSDNAMLRYFKDSFEESEQDRKPTQPLKVFMGPVATGSAVLGDSRKIDKIRKGNRKLIGIDMETFGVYYAAKNYTSVNQTKAISIKSISDFADEQKSDAYRKYAAFTSANFIYQLILMKFQ